MTTQITLHPMTIQMEDIDYIPLFRHSDGKLKRYRESITQSGADSTIMVAANREITTVTELFGAILLASTAAVARVLIVGGFTAGVLAEDLRDALIWDASGKFRVHHSLANIKSMIREISE